MKRKPISGPDIFVVAVSVFAVLVLLFYGLAEKRDPSHDGLSLSDWLAHLGWGEKQYHEQSLEAVQAIGTNGIPLMLEYFAANDSAPLYLAQAKLAKLTGMEIERPATKWWKASAGFKALGPVGQPAVPQLLELIEKKSASIAWVVEALAATKSPQAIICFTNLLVDSDAKSRAAGVSGLGAMQADARLLTVQISELARHDPSELVRISALETLGKIADGQHTVHFLIERYQIETNRYPRWSALVALGNFPAQSDAIKPVLEAATLDPDRLVRIGAERALQNLTNNTAKQSAAKTPSP